MPVRYAHASSSRAAQTQAMDLDDDQEADGLGAEDQDEEDTDEGWTRDTFTPRPMTSATASGPINNLMVKTSEAMRHIDDSLEQFGQVAAAVADCDARHKSLTEIQGRVLRLLNARQELQIKNEVLKSLEDRLKRGEHMMDIVREYDTAARSKIDEWSRQTERKRFKKDKRFEHYQSTIWDKTHPNDPLPPMSRFLPRTEEDESDEEEEIEEGGTMVSYRCPLSSTTLKDAHTSEICGHSYTGEHILHLLARASTRRKTIKCPQAGCAAQLTSAVVKPDPALQKKADEWVKRQERLQRETAARENYDDEVVDNE